MKIRIDQKNIISIVYDIAPYLVVAISFCIVFACSLSFRYVEGDDASSVAFHAFGRNLNIQPPYSPYHGMMDVFLGVLPASETAVRHSAIAMSAIAAIVMVALIVRLISDWLPDIENWKLCIVGPTILLCSPEIFYLSIGYFPSIIAMSLVLAAHVLIRLACWRDLAFSIATRPFFPLFVLAAVLFGVGVACRWDVGLYLVLILVDLALLSKTQGQLSLGVKLGLLWGLIAVLASMSAIFCTGYGIGEIQSTVGLARKEILSRDSWFATIGAYQTLFTPAFVVFFLAGITYTYRERRSLLLMLLLGIMSVSPYLFSREPKMLLPAFPVMCLSIAIGVNQMWFGKSNRRYLMLARVASVVVLALPWLVGIQFTSKDTLWGPAFQIRTVSQDSYGDRTQNRVQNKGSDNRVSIANFSLDFAGGFAVPTPEGARPVGGHAFVLFSGEWLKFIAELDEERRKTVDLSLSSHLNILQDEGNSYLTTKLLEIGFVTADPRRNLIADGVNERKFFDSHGNQLSIQILSSSKSLFDGNQIEELLKLNPSKEVILYCGSSSTLKRLAEMCPECIVPLGPFSAIVDLGAFYRAIRKASEPTKGLP